MSVARSEWYVDGLRRRFPNWQDREADLARLAELAARSADLDRFLAEMQLAERVEADEDVSGPARRVALSSVHQAKGLEWPVVFVLQVESGSFPSGWAVSEGNLDEAQARAGQPEEGLTTLDEALVLVERTDERHWEAELYRLRAELLLMQGDEAEAEASLHRAIDVARRQSARSWELRATTSLARLWQKQGKRAEAHQVLAEIYGWFTEGFDTADLKKARALLDALS